MADEKVRAVHRAAQPSILDHPRMQATLTHEAHRAARPLAHDFIGAVRQIIVRLREQRRALRAAPPEHVQVEIDGDEARQLLIELRDTRQALRDEEHRANADAERRARYAL